ncbi:hypothetical protein BC826DRAFT_1058099, partial [Russula brevipes]
MGPRVPLTKCVCPPSPRRLGRSTRRPPGGRHYWDPCWVHMGIRQEAREDRRRVHMYIATRIC